MNGSRELKSLRQVRDTEKMRKHIFWSGYLGVSEPRMEDLKSLQSGEHSQYLQAHTGFPGARLEILHWDMKPFEALFCLLTTCAIGSCRWAKQNLPNMSKCSVLGSMLVSMFRSIC
jgi:hypothetical protein